jgi:hypothetical protein
MLTDASTNWTGQPAVHIANALGDGFLATDHRSAELSGGSQQGFAQTLRGRRRPVTRHVDDGLKPFVNPPRSTDAACLAYVRRVASYQPPAARGAGGAVRPVDLSHRGHLWGRQRRRADDRHTLSPDLVVSRAVVARDRPALRPGVTRRGTGGARGRGLVGALERTDRPPHRPASGALGPAPAPPLLHARPRRRGPRARDPHERRARIAVG